MGLTIVPDDLQQRRLWQNRLLSLLLAALLAGSAVGAAVCGLLVTTAPPWMCLPLEPLSLLLTPGFAIEQMISGAYTFHTQGVLRWNGLIYFALFAILLLRRPGSRSRRRSGAAGSG